MQRIFVFSLFVLIMASCKSDKPKVIAVGDKGEKSEEVITEDFFEDTNELYAKLDRLKLRVDSSLNSKTVKVMSEGDTLLYLAKHSRRRDNLKLRGRYYHEPWVYVQHVKSQKKGWVYAGACVFDAKALKKEIDSSSPLLKQVYADDLEWEGTVPTGWSVATISDGIDFKKFIIRFKEFVAKDNKEAIAKLIKYPIRNVASKSYFLDNYDRIFSDQLKLKISEQRLDRIFRNSQGASLGNGDVYFQQIDNDYKIIAINFKGRDDIKRELMNQLTATYVGQNAIGNNYSIKSFKIKDFLELTLSYEESNGYPKTKSLGKFVYETSHNGRHGFVQDSQDSTRLRLLFEKPDSASTLLKILGDTQPPLSGISFMGS